MIAYVFKPLLRKHKFIWVYTFTKMSLHNSFVALVCNNSHTHNFRNKYFVSVRSLSQTVDIKKRFNPGD